MNTAVGLFGLFGPLFVWPLEMLFPLPHVIEEIYKTIVVFFVLKEKPSYKNGLVSVLFAGILFASTETVLYMININASGDIGLILRRFLTTAILHSATFGVIYTIGRRKNLLILGLITATLIHFLYNLYI